MSIGKISGPMLQTNLARQGVDLAIDTDLTYHDVTNRRVGHGTTTPSQALDVPGNVRLANLTILGNTITSNTGKIGLGSTSNIVITGGSAYDIIYTDGAGNLAFGNLNSLSGLDGFTGNNITLGSNTAGYLVSNAVAFTTGTSVTNAIAQLNYVLGGITNNTGTNIHVASATVSGAINAGTLTVNTATASTSTTTGALTVAGGAGIVGNLFVGNISIVGNTITGNTGVSFGGNLFANITGNVINPAQPYITSVGTLTSLTVSGNIFADIISPRVTAATTFSGTGAVGLPVGTNSNRPTGGAGYFRYNSDAGSPEYYNGSAWVSVLNSITDQAIYPDGLANSFTLTKTSTAEGLLVSINGTLQTPGIAYTVSGTTITFAEVPTVTDNIDVRYIAAAISTNNDTNLVDTSNVAVGTVVTIIDSFPTSTYRSAKYVISSANAADAQFSEVMLTQFGSTVAVSTIANVRTNTNSVTFTANVSGGTVNLLAQGSTTANQLRIQRIYFAV